MVGNFSGSSPGMLHFDTLPIIFRPCLPVYQIRLTTKCFRVMISRPFAPRARKLHKCYSKKWAAQLLSLEFIIIWSNLASRLIWLRKNYRFACYKLAYSSRYRSILILCDINYVWFFQWWKSNEIIRRKESYLYQRPLLFRYVCEMLF